MAKYRLWQANGLRVNLILKLYLCFIVKKYIIQLNNFSRDEFLVNPMFLPGVNQKPQEPNIDFELDVKVFINSGKCVLHTKDSVKEDEIKL